MSFTKIACVADDSPKAQAALKEIEKKYEIVEITKRRMSAQVIVVLGGDGFMLQTLHTYMKMKLPFYGINCGTVGFLMNHYSEGGVLLDRVNHARPSTLYPLHMYARCTSGKEKQALAFNEVSLFRQGRQAAKIRVSIDHVVRLKELICDGVLVSTPAGSTAYNFSAGGPIIPLGANLMALTPLVPFGEGAGAAHYYRIVPPSASPSRNRKSARSTPWLILPKFRTWRKSSSANSANQASPCCLTPSTTSRSVL